MDMSTVKQVIKELKLLANPKALETLAYFGISGVNSLGLSVPQMRKLAKEIGINHPLALKLWKTKIHEAQHIATMIADPKLVTEKLMEQWLKDLNSWDLVDGTCSNVFRKTPWAYEKVKEWSTRKREFEKRAAFSLICYLAVHDKKEADKPFEDFLEIIKRESSDERNFVKKAINWALRQIGKRNLLLCKKAIKTSKEIYAKGDSSSRWIATDALRELEKYQREGKIKSVGSK